MISKRGCSISTIINNGAIKHLYSDNINEKIKNLYPYGKYSLDETYEKLLNMYEICPICGDKIYIFKEGKICRNNGIILNQMNYWIDKEDKDCNKYELKHKYFRQNSRDTTLANNALKLLRKNNKEWLNNQNIVNANNLFIGREKQKLLYKNDPDLYNKHINQCKEMGKKYGILNIHYAQEAKIQAVKDSISQLNLIITENSIDTSKIFELKQNDIYGAYVIRAKFKAYKNTDKENNIYNVLVCKSVKIYNEIYWVLRVLSHPEKQNKIVSDNNLWTVAKWWYISNLYYDFEFILLTDKNGVSEEEALLVEAKYAFDNDMLCDKKQIEINGFSINHSYCNL